jgi:regulator of protease activity HflC (stomatin/prohibitin superfamily)
VGRPKRSPSNTCTWRVLIVLNINWRVPIPKGSGWFLRKSCNTADTITETVATPALPAGMPRLKSSSIFSYTEVDSGFVGVVYRQGAAVRAIQPGPHLLVPFLENVSYVSTKTLIWQPNEDGASSDLQQVTTQVTLAYHFDPAFAVYFATQLISNEPNSVENKAVNPAIVEAVKAVSAQYVATDLIQKRPLVRDGIDKMVTARLTQYHIVVETVSITDFKFTKEYNDSIEAKVKAMQDAERAQNELVKVKIEAEKAEAEAKGKALANVADAEGEAKAIIAKANAQAEANRKLAASITPELILNKAIERWDGVRPMVEGGKH